MAAEFDPRSPYTPQSDPSNDRAFRPAVREQVRKATRLSRSFN
jgi:hypothetical protein